VTGRNGRGFRGRSGGVGGRYSTLTLRRDGERVYVLGEWGVVKDAEPRTIDCCTSILRVGGEVGRFFLGSLA